MTNTRIRAVSEGQKQERRELILQVAWEAFLGGSFAATRVEQIAFSAGVAKGTFYLYFPTKDALFLALMSQKVCDWVDLLNARLAALPAGAGPTPAALAIRETLDASPGLIRLLASMYASVEQHATPGGAIPVQQAMIGRMRVSAGHFARILALLSVEEGMRAALRCNALIIGMQQLGMPTSHIPEPLIPMELKMTRANMFVELQASIEALLWGMARTGG